MRGPAFTFLSLASLTALPSLASRLPVERRGIPSSDGVKTVRLNNGGNVLYMTNITIAGVENQVQIDTGSTDLWVAPLSPLKDFQNGPAKANNVTEQYGSGTASGPILTSSFSWGSYSVENQAFVNATSTTVFPDTLFPRGARGILGLGFGDVNGTIITTAFSLLENNTDRGLNPIANIFSQHPEVSNFISIFLGRSDDLEASSEGALTIGEYLAGYENISKSPKIPVFSIPGQDSTLRWSVLLDKITINGKSVSLKSQVKGVPKGKALVVTDSGAQDAIVPAWLAEALYSSAPGAFLSTELNSWIIPCNYTADVRFTFGNQEVIIHPLDLNTIADRESDSDPVVCGGAYQPNNLGTGFSDFDMLLGDGFLRNVYTLFDYGNVTSAGDVIEDPYINILPLTNAKDALGDFNRSRQNALSQLPPEQSLADSRKQFGGNSTSSSSSSSSKDDKDTDSIVGAVTSDSDDSDWSTLLDRIDHWGPVVVGLLAGNVVIGIILCFIGLAVCIRRGRTTGATRTVNPSYTPVQFREEIPRAEDEVYPGKYSD
ncbi:acid protease [Dentipellis sp. KUC8613]|nr:acid protease [Dentipellis sp. KUC8613]